jgi:hypothetical protein
MKALIISLFIISSSLAFSQELTCSLKGTAIHFVNGIANTEEDAILSTDRLETIYKINSQKIDRLGKVEFDYSYNETHGIMKDLLESGAQKIHSAAQQASLDLSIDQAYVIMFQSFYLVTGLISPSLQPVVRLAIEDASKMAAKEQADVDVLKNDLKNILKANKKLIIVSHSQGNLVTNRALRELQLDSSFNYEFYEEVISNVRFATPEANAVALNSSHAINSDDIILYVGDQNFNFVLFLPESEYELRKTFESFINHSFLETYFYNFDEFKETRPEFYTANLSLIELKDFSIDKIIKSAQSLSKHPRCPKAIINYFINDLTVDFDSTDPEVPTIEGFKYTWNFGDGKNDTSTSSKTISNLYPGAGTYTVTLRVTDDENSDFGEDSFATKSITLGTDWRRCSGEPGKYHTNPNGILGGFVANTATVASTVILNHNVSVCGQSQVLGASSISATESWSYSEVVNSNIIDSSIEAYAFYIASSTISLNSKLHIKPELIYQGFLSIGDSNISNTIVSGGDLKMGSSMLSNTTLRGNSQISETTLISCNFAVASSQLINSTQVTGKNIDAYSIYSYFNEAIIEKLDGTEYRGPISEY